MKTTGKIHFIYAEQVISDKFKKREFILEITESPEYPEFVKFEVINDKCALLDKYQAGQYVDIEFNLKGRIVDYKGVNTCFDKHQCWKISEAGEKAT